MMASQLCQPWLYIVSLINTLLRCHATSHSKLLPQLCHLLHVVLPGSGTAGSALGRLLKHHLHSIRNAVRLSTWNPGCQNLLLQGCVALRVAPELSILSSCAV